MKVPIENKPNLERDIKSNAIINTDNIGYRRAIEARKAKVEMEKRLSKVENELADIKSILERIISKLDK